MKDYVAIGEHLGAGLEKLKRDAPGPMGAFTALMEAATAPETLTTKIKELIALAIAVSLRCDGCIAHHAKSVLVAGASREEVRETVGVAILMGGGPSVVYGIEAIEAFEQFKLRRDP